MVTFQQIVLPALHKMMGLQADRPLITLRATATEEIKKQPGRKEFQRGIVTESNGELSVSLTGSQGSHILRSMSQANCLVILPHENAGIKEGQPVDIQLLGKSL